jgi:hypothetical protein
MAATDCSRAVEIKRLTGAYKVPTLVLDDGTVIDHSSNIVSWTRDNPL